MTAGTPQGWKGWDAYAPFYDWENTRTFGRRDLAFWREHARRARGAVLELGCGTGRLMVPLANAGVRMIGVDRSAAMLALARGRVRRMRRDRRPLVMQGDVRRLPLRDASVGMVLAPYGLLQSLLSDADLRRTLADAHRVLRRGGLIGIDLVPDLPAWQPYRSRVRLAGSRPGGGTVTLIESVRQDRRRGLTVFDERFVERAHGRTRTQRFTLTFRTRSVRRMTGFIERAGFGIERVLGDYENGPLAPGSDAWLILARKQ